MKTYSVIKYNRFNLDILLYTLITIAFVLTTFATNSSNIDPCVFPKWFFFGISINIIALFYVIYTTKYNIAPRELIIYFILVLICCLMYYQNASYKELLTIAASAIIYITFSRITINKLFLSLILCGLSTINLLLLLLSCLLNFKWESIFESITGLIFPICLGTIGCAYILLHTKNLNKYGAITMYCLITTIIIATIYVQSRIGLICSGSVLLYCITKRRSAMIVAFIVIGIILICFVKLNSTTGRFFILKTSIELIQSPKEIIIGKGSNSFRQNYMRHQAEILKNSNQNILYLADNIKHPLNELVNIFISYGLLSIILIAILLFTMMYKRKYDLISYLILYQIILFSSLSYPFKYPITWLLLSIALSQYCDINIKPKIKIKKKTLWAVISIFSVFNLFFLLYTILLS